MLYYQKSSLSPVLQYNYSLSVLTEHLTHILCS